MENPTITEISSKTGIPERLIRVATFNMGEYFGIAYDGGDGKRTAWRIRFDADEKDYQEVYFRLRHFHENANT